MRFLVDAQLPQTIVEWLVGEGHEAEHVRDFNLGSAPDQAVWSRALAISAIIVSKDRDFADWALARRPAVQVVWLRFGNLNKAELIKRLQAAWPTVLTYLAAGNAVVETGP